MIRGTWISKWSPKSPVELPSLMRDDPEVYPQRPRAARRAGRNERTVEEVLGRVLPKIR